MAGSPTAVMKELGAGRTIPIYAYAGNNPVAFSDPTGLIVQLPDKMSQQFVDAVNKCLESQTCRDKFNAMAESKHTFVLREADPKDTVGGRRGGTGPMREVDGDKTSNVVSDADGGDYINVVFDVNDSSQPGWFKAGHEFSHAERYAQGGVAGWSLPADVPGHHAPWKAIETGPRSYGYPAPYSEGEYQAVRDALRIAKEIGKPMKDVRGREVMLP